MLEWMDPGPPEDRVAFFESNRNLFYVACSRPKWRPALMFTQLLSAAALAKVSELFGDENVIALPADPRAVCLTSYAHRPSTGPRSVPGPVRHGEQPPRSYHSGRGSERRA